MAKSNKTFLILSVLGIFFVVFGHMQNKPDIFMNNIFPFYSFHMAVFIFVSGYFFHDQPIIEFIKKKIKKLILPYFVYRVVYAIINIILTKCDIITYGSEWNLTNLFIAPFTTHGNQYYFNFASWFLLSIFFIQLIYLLLFKLQKITKITKFKLNEWIVLIIFLVAAAYSVKMKRTGFNYTIIRILFLLPFYQIGIIYKKTIEKYDTVNNYIYFIVILLIQTVLLKKCNLTYNLNLLNFTNNYVILFLASLNGIAFWLRVSKILEKYIGENKIINYIGNNTLTVMMNHIFIFFLINFTCYTIQHLNGNILKGFDGLKFRNNLWYVYDSYKNPGINLIYILLSIAIPVFIKVVCEKKLNHI